VKITSSRKKPGIQYVKILFINISKLFARHLMDSKFFIFIAFIFSGHFYKIILNIRSVFAFIVLSFNVKVKQLVCMLFYFINIRLILFFPDFSHFDENFRIPLLPPTNFFHNSVSFMTL